MEYSSNGYEDEVNNSHLELLVDCSLQELSFLEKLDPTYLSELIHGTTDDDDLSINVDELEEWLDATFVYKDGNYLSNEDGISCSEIPRNDIVNNDTCHNDNEKADTIKTNFQQSHFNGSYLEENKTQQKISAMQTNLEMTMMKTQLSQKVLNDRTKNFSPSINDTYSVPTSIFNNSKRKSLSDDINDIKTIQNYHRKIYKYSYFFVGKQNSLTRDVEASRNHLKMLGISLRNMELREENSGGRTYQRVHLKKTASMA